MQLDFNGGRKSADNLLINPGGRICIAECKLWHNPEAMRSLRAK
jgi:hypothetical protein